MITRYDVLLDLIDKYKPQSIVEVGVWNGANAIRMINRAKQYHSDITYTGYDLFEEATPETDEKEFNVKGHNSVKAVGAFIRSETGINPTLIKGDTNKTLKPDVVADFVFLDGGHSVDTIFNDYNAVKNSKIIVMDDYYTGGDIDVSKFGCNRKLVKNNGLESLYEADVYEKIKNYEFVVPCSAAYTGYEDPVFKEGMTFQEYESLLQNAKRFFGKGATILPQKDPVKGGGFCQLVLVENG